MREGTVSAKITVQDNVIAVMRVGEVDYISLTDLARVVNSEDPSGFIRNWMLNKNSFAFYSLWEELNNEDFNSVEMRIIKIK